jgi:hypothetical protein
MKPASHSLLSIPGIGHSLAADLNQLGIREVAQLRGRDPEQLYNALCHAAGQKMDRCVLYAFRCAVYYASETGHNPELLKWWNWKDSAPPKRARKSKASTALR